MKKLVMMRKVAKMCVIAFISSMAIPDPALAGLAAETLTSVGKPLVQALVLSTFGWTIAYILQALGQGQIAGMVKLGVVFLCFSILISIIWNGINAVATFFGLSL